MIGPNKGNMDNVEPPIDVGDGPSRKSVKGDAISVIGEITNVTVSKTDYQIRHFILPYWPNLYCKISSTI